MQFARRQIEIATQLPGFQNWEPEFDVLHMPRPRQRPDHLPGEGRFAGVMLLLFDAGNETQLILTKRRDDLKHHPGQISFPGGSVEQGETIDQAALRETEEEIGVARDVVQLTGELNPVYIPPSDFTVQPFVGWVDERPEMFPSDYEVAEIIETPVQRFFEPDVFATGEVLAGNRTIIAPHYRILGHQVWGATALILSELVARLKTIAD